MSERVKTKLPDLRGNLHAYSVEPMPFDRAFDLGLELAAIIGGPIGGAFKDLLLGSQLADAELDQRVLGSALGELGDLPERIIRRGGSELIAKILRGVVRIGEDESGQVKQDLGDAADRTAAFGGGNIGEAMRAVHWVLAVNYGPFLTDLWEVLQPQLVGLVTAPTKSGHDTPTPENTSESSAPTNSELKPTEIVSSIS